jgi:Mrp family chromosome partitioning ATPase
MMESPDAMPTQQETPREEGNRRTVETPETEEAHSLVRLLKPIVFHQENGKAIDHAVVSPRFYNAFNYGLIAGTKESVRVAVGVTSANNGEGKSLVAANLAVSLAVAHQRETVVVDLNFRSPKVHAIFGTRPSPGLVDALNDAPINAYATSIEHLFVLPAGNLAAVPLAAEKLAAASREHQGGNTRSPLGLDQVAAFRNVIYSLKEQFDFIVVDMPSIRDPRMPAMLTIHLDGMLVVVEGDRTRQDDLDRIFRRVNPSQLIGFVYNRSRDAEA